MFASIFYDRFTRKESGEVAYAITDLFNPFNLACYGWSPISVYLFWNPATHEPLYIGYSANVGRRFAEHCGLSPCDYPACKYHEIDDYFSQNTHIAISLLVQGNEIKMADSKDLNDATKLEVLNNPFVIEKSHVTAIEARLITSFAKANGKRPAWNGNLGAVDGQQLASPADLRLLKAMAGEHTPLAARGPLRQIAAAPWFETAEHYLHGHRFLLINAGAWPAPGIIPRAWDPSDPDHGGLIEQYLKQAPFDWK